MKFAFYKAPGSPLDRVIRFWMRGPYAHVEAVLADYGNGTYQCASSVPGVGVRIATLALPASDYDIVDGPGDAAKARAWFEARAGKAYDYVGLFGFVVRPATGDSRNKFWCSEACLEAIGFPEPWRYDPNGMHDIVTFLGTTK